MMKLSDANLLLCLHVIQNSKLVSNTPHPLLHKKVELRFTFFFYANSYDLGKLPISIIYKVYTTAAYKLVLEDNIFILFYERG